MYRSAHDNVVGWVNLGLSDIRPDVLYDGHECLAEGFEVGEGVPDVDHAHGLSSPEAGVVAATL